MTITGDCFAALAAAEAGIEVFDNVLSDADAYRRATLASEFTSIELGQAVFQGIAGGADLSLPRWLQAQRPQLVPRLTFFRRHRATGAIGARLPGTSRACARNGGSGANRTVGSPGTACRRRSTGWCSSLPGSFIRARWRPTTARATARDSFRSCSGPARFFPSPIDRSPRAA